MKKYVTDDDLVAMLRARLRRRGSAKYGMADLCKELGVNYDFIAGYVAPQRRIPHAQRKLLEALGYETRRYYKLKNGRDR